MKVLVPLRARAPTPDFVKVTMLACCVIGAEMVSPVSARPLLTVMTGLAALNCKAVKVCEPALTIGVNA